MGNMREALRMTGFIICEFEPDNDPCECCGKSQVQLYWRRSDPFSMDGSYFCDQCVIKEHTTNVTDLVNMKEPQELI